MRHALVAVLLPALLLATACGSSRQAAPETAATPSSAGTASGIPGLSAEVLATLPPLPPLPGKLTKDATPEQIHAEAERLAQREARSGGFSAEHRTLHLVHGWTEAVNELRRGEPSVVPGLTIGELEDQPPGPALPAIFDLRTTSADLEHHAWIVAMHERDQQAMGDLAMDKRVVFLVWYWQKPLAERQAIEQAWLDRNAQRSAHKVATAEQLRKFKDDERALQAKYDDEMVKVRMTFNPVLDPEQTAELNDMAEHYEFEEDYGNDKPFRGPVQ